MNTGPLNGIRVVEAGLLIQGPQAAALLAAWGADVIKVEQPTYGDQSRWIPVAPDSDRSPIFEATNRSKRAMTVNLGCPEGAEIFGRLAEWADVVISNFMPGTMDAWGLGYDALAARNPRLVYAAGSGFGLEGPDATREGNDLSAQAMGGIMTITGADPELPLPIGVAIADHLAAQNLAAGIIAALFARTRTGRGQRVDTSLYGGQLWAQASEITACLISGQPAAPGGRGHSLVPGLYGIVPTADGALALAGVTGMKARTRFFEAIGRPELFDAFPQKLYWEKEKAALFPLLDEVFRTRTTAEWSEVLTAAGIRHAPVRTHAEVATDPGARANGYITESDGQTVVNPPVAFSDTPAEPLGRSPELGEHTELVLVDLGYTWDDIAALRDTGAI